jgi:hypothetical protein
VKELLLDARATIRLVDLDPARRRGHRDGSVVAQGAERDRRGDCDRGFDGRIGPEPGVRAPVEVERDPEVGRLLEVELLHVQLAVAGAREPVDAVDGVAVDIGSHRAHQRRGRLVPPAHRRRPVDR